MSKHAEKHREKESEREVHEAELRPRDASAAINPASGLATLAMAAGGNLAALAKR